MAKKKSLFVAAKVTFTYSEHGAALAYAASEFVKFGGLVELVSAALLLAMMLMAVGKAMELYAAKHGF